MKYQTFFRILFICYLLSLYNFTSANTKTDTTYYEIWEIDTLENIGGHSTTVIGNPKVVSTDMGRAVQFDGVGDMLLIDANPLGNTTEYTVEIIFKPAASFPNNVDPRFVHIQDLNDPDAKRVMMEIRINSRNLWYLDGFMKTDMANLTLIDTGKVHPTEQWMHAATTYKDGVFKTYVNGIEELSGNVAYSTALVAPTAKTSLGARMNQQNWYKGIIKRFKVTQKALAPEDFLSITTPSSIIENLSQDRIQIFPTRADDFINIAVDKISTELNLKIYNTLGQVVNTMLLRSDGNEQFRINTSNLLPGLYYLVFTWADFKESVPVLIKH